MLNETIKIPVNIASEVSWKIKEPIFSPKSRELLRAFSIIGIAVIIFSVILKNYLFILLVALIALIIYFSKNKEQDMVDFRLDKEGLQISGKFYPYSSFESFWIFPARNASRSEAGRPADSERELALRYKSKIMPLLAIPFRNEDEFKIQNLLENYLEESEEKESLTDLLRKRFF